VGTGRNIPAVPRITLSSAICPPKPSLPWPLSPRGREGNKKEQGKTLFLSFSLLSLWERRVGVVRASQGTTLRYLVYHP